MKPLAAISMLLSLSLLGACSTTPVVRDRVEYLTPSAGLLLPCERPALVPSKTNGDIINNSLARQSAFDACNIRHQCLLDWHKAAAATARAKGKAVPTPASCGKFK